MSHFPPNTAFGDLLRYFRRRSQVSQLALSLSADVSTRHISFLENGRSAPSRVMINRLAAALGISQAEEAELLASAGFNPHLGGFAPGLESQAKADLCSTLAQISVAATRADALDQAVMALSMVGLPYFFTVIGKATNSEVAQLFLEEIRHANLGIFSGCADHCLRPELTLVQATIQASSAFRWRDALPRFGSLSSGDRLLNQQLAANGISDGVVVPVRDASGCLRAMVAYGSPPSDDSGRSLIVARAVGTALLDRLLAVDAGSATIEGEVLRVLTLSQEGRSERWISDLTGIKEERVRDILLNARARWFGPCDSVV